MTGSENLSCQHGTRYNTCDICSVQHTDRLERAVIFLLVVAAVGLLASWFYWNDLEYASHTYKFFLIGSVSAAGLYLLFIKILNHHSKG